MTEAVPPRRDDPRALACIFAHPDDETFSSAATLARYAAAGVSCHLLCATDGDAGRSSGVAVESPAELGRLRRAELGEAAAILGVRSVHSLGLPDGALGEVDPAELLGAIVCFLRTHRPQVVITFGPEGGPNAHRDHKVISRLTSAAFMLAALPSARAEQLGGGALAPHAVRRLYYVSWEPPAPGVKVPHPVALTARIEARSWEPVKRAAFAAHRTQRTLHEQFERLAMTDTEAFALAKGVSQPRAVVDDLFEGL